MAEQEPPRYAGLTENPMAQKKANPYVADARTAEAKKRGFPARSVFKLEEIQKKMQLLKRGMRVLDLGAAPGSWSLYAMQQVGPGGKVLAIDISPITQGFGPNVSVVQGDAFDLGSEVLARFAPYDVVLSDMAPKTSGVRSLDQANSFELFVRALDVACAVSKPENSAFVAKIFMGAEFNQAIDLAKKTFKKTKVIRPEGVRPNSKEVFLVGQGLRSGGWVKPDPENLSDSAPLG
jgi:23S rRNA (uridine2552-2'-O)-methyltransferase